MGHKSFFMSKFYFPQMKILYLHLNLKLGTLFAHRKTLVLEMQFLGGGLRMDLMVRRCVCCTGSVRRDAGNWRKNGDKRTLSDGRGGIAATIIQIDWVEVDDGRAMRLRRGCFLFGKISRQKSGANKA